MKKNNYIKQFAVSLLMILLYVSVYAQPEMVFVKGGKFMMGRNSSTDKVQGKEFKNELPRHKVRLKSFYIGKYEVSVKEYKEFVKATGYKMPSEPDSAWFAEHPDTKAFYPSSENQWWGWQDDLPMHNVNWYDAVRYCNWKSKQEGLKEVYTFVSQSEVKWDLTANGYRLPTEAEWEYAARGGNKSKKYIYAGSNNAAEVAWYDVTSNLKGPAKIGTKKPNELGIYDMSGNVWEWCNDYYSASYYRRSPEENPQGPGENIYRVLRSGAWHYREALSRIADRDGPEAVLSNFNYGFRIARNE